MSSQYSAGSVHYTETRTVQLHATAKRWHPAPEGGSYEENFQCTHNHPDTRAGYDAVKDCGQRLARILATGRIPGWAKNSAY